MLAENATFGALATVAYDVTGVPYKFMYAADANINTDYSSPSFDDSAWATGRGAFGFDAAPSGAQTKHTGTDRGYKSRIWLRQHLTTLTPGRDCVVEIWRDDGAKFWWNGVNYPVTTTADYYRVLVTVPGAAVTGADLACLRVTDGRNDADTADVGSDGNYASMNFTSI